MGARPEYASDGLRLTHDASGTAYGSKPYRPNPARRNFIHGPIQPLEYARDPVLPAWSMWIVGMFLAAFITPLILGAAS